MRNKKVREKRQMDKVYLRGKRKKRVLTGLLLFSLLCSGVTGCGSSKNDAETAAGNYEEYEYATESADYSYDADAETAEAVDNNYMVAASADSGNFGLKGDVQTQSANVEETAGEQAVAADNAAAGGNNQVQNTASKKSDNKKIIKKYYYDYETETFDKSHEYLKEQIEKYNGYISSSQVNGTDNRTLHLTARIPADVSDEFVNQLGSLGTMISQSESADDITLQYTDTESRISSLKTEQERLNALLEKADSLETIITLEDRLTEVRYELENYQSQKNLYDDLVSYSTVNIVLQEVDYTVTVDEDSVLSRITSGLKTTFRDLKVNFADFIVWLIVNLPYLIIWAVVIFVIVKIVKGVRRRRKAKKEKKIEKMIEAANLSSRDDIEEKSNEKENK